jgi:pyrroloquinoline quinone biosynthesis protein D
MIPDTTETDGSDAAVCYQLARGYRVQWENAQNGFVLLYPEGMVSLNKTAGFLLDSLQKKVSTHDLVKAAMSSFKAVDSEKMTKDISAFIALAVKRGWVTNG